VNEARVRGDLTHAAEVIRVLIADDHAVVREGLRALIATEPGLALAGEAADGEEAVRQARALSPDVILLDLVMPRLGGLGAIQEITRENPGARVLVLTSFAERDDVLPAIRAGALGYLLKDASPQELIQAIRTVARGEASLDPSVAGEVVRELRAPPAQPQGAEPLTEREIDVLRLVAQGLSNQDIAARLVVAERTVRTHVSHILYKLRLANRTQAALYATRSGLGGADRREARHS
jgi:NarL family two-component system response regulator LiaR